MASAHAATRKATVASGRAGRRSASATPTRASPDRDGATRASSASDGATRRIASRPPAPATSAGSSASSGSSWSPRRSAVALPRDAARIATAASTTAAMSPARDAAPQRALAGAQDPAQQQPEPGHQHQQRDERVAAEGVAHELTAGHVLMARHREAMPIPASTPGTSPASTGQPASAAVNTSD